MSPIASFAVEGLERTIQLKETEAMDIRTTVSTLRQAVGRFVKDRSWERYHTPKNLAMSIAIEAAELMERFQWVSSDESIELVKYADARAAIADELADVLIYCLALSNQADIDLSAAILQKLNRNEKRFPVGYDPT
jgi:NTP pyrophosphatase (non-canonical NTP hydrolase)